MLTRSYALASISFALSILGATDAAATAQRTFVSTSGVDNPACSIAAPCRSFGAAIIATTSGGEVIVLDSGGYGIVTITQAVSIIAPSGVYAGISVFGGDDGVTVFAGPTDRVVLRGLTVNGQGGNVGIRVLSGNVTQIEDCTVANMGAQGIRIEGGATVNMARIVVRSNGGAPGILVQPSAAAQITATLADSTLTSNAGAGIFAVTTVAGSTVIAALSRVTASRNSSSGFAAFSNSVGSVTMTIVDSIAVENGGNGVAVAGSNATAIVSGSSLVRNVLPDLAEAGAVLRTAENNAVTGRGPGDIIGTLTANPLK